MGNMKTKFIEFLNEYKDYKGEYFHFLTKGYDIEKAHNLIEKNPSKYLNENGDPYEISLEEVSNCFSDGSYIEKNGVKKFKMGIKINPEHAMNIADEDLKEYGIFVLDNGFNFLIDGWHRAYKLWKNGEKNIKCYLIDDENDLKIIRIN